MFCREEFQYLKDLEGYLKRSDYLNGFTKVEQ
jgi:hypothetical protein